MIYSISPWKAAKGHIMPGLCQVNNTWLEPTYYIYPWCAWSKIGSFLCHQKGRLKRGRKICKKKASQFLDFKHNPSIMLSLPITEATIINHIFHVPYLLK